MSRLEWYFWVFVRTFGGEAAIGDEAWFEWLFERVKRKGGLPWVKNGKVVAPR